MKAKTVLRRFQTGVRRWGTRNKEKIFEELGNRCKDCGTLKNLEVHHIEYKIGIEFVELLCSGCHLKFHKKELKKRLLIIMLNNVESSDCTTLEGYKRELEKRIDKIGINVIPNITLDGLPREDNLA